MRWGIGVLVALASLAACVSTPARRADVSAGYESLRIDAAGRPIQIDVWYPTAAAEAPHSYNFGAGSVAVRGAPEAGRHPVILLSHGAMGAASNYSWIAEPLARHGYVVVGVSHFRESPVFGPSNMEPASVGRFGDRTRDFGAALDFLVTRSAYAALVDPVRLGALGHSSGGATVVMLAGARFAPADLAAYCVTARPADKGCLYPANPGEGQMPVPLARPIRAIVALDPAVGPAFSSEALGAIKTPALVVGSADNDFLPFPAHAGRYGASLGSAELVKLEGGEGHFVYVDRCTLPVEVMGVPLCRDRAGVDRAAVQAKLVPVITAFFDAKLAK